MNGTQHPRLHGRLLEKGDVWPFGMLLMKGQGRDMVKFDSLKICSIVLYMCIFVRAVLWPIPTNANRTVENPSKSLIKHLTVTCVCASNTS
jgi:hypothetical protein